MTIRIKSKGLSRAIGTGDFYAYTRSLLPEIRAVMDTKGNKDGKLDDAELKFLPRPGPWSSSVTNSSNPWSVTPTRRSPARRPSSPPGSRLGRRTVVEARPAS